MLFNSFDFGIFFPVVFLLYWLLFKKNIRARNIFLIIVSYIFYGWWDWRFLSLIIISSTVDFIAGQRIYASESSRERKTWLIISLVVNLGFLGFFKYFNFFADSFVNAFEFFGMHFKEARLNIILPVGISFYTFQTLSYTLDIYYKKFEPTKDVFSFFAFVAFFPQLVAGPIERARNLLPQFYENRNIDYNMLRSGMLLMGWGFFKKIVIADRLAIFVDNVYGDVGNVQGLPLLLGVIFFGIQLYLDFSAYSDIAIGTARMLGFNLSENFRRPYFASSFSDFWKRWHISLSSWFRDYVYIPLGGSRVKKGRLIWNITVVFLLSGLWHGASWNFVIWGAINGMFLIVFDSFLDRKEKKALFRIFSSLFVTIAWLLSLIFFRAQGLQDAITVFGDLFQAGTREVIEFGLLGTELKLTLYLLIFFFVFELFMERAEGLYQWFVKRHFIIRWTVYLALTASIILLGSYGVGLNDTNFIYFQF